MLKDKDGDQQNVYSLAVWGRLASAKYKKLAYRNANKIFKFHSRDKKVKGS